MNLKKKLTNHQKINKNLMNQYKMNKKKIEGLK